MKNLKIAVVMVLIILLGSSFSTAATAVDSQFKVAARAAILMDPYSGRVLFDQNDHQRLPPASVTKVMTMLLILEATHSGRVKWDEPIPTTVTAAAMGGSQVYLKEGEELSLREMFKAIAVVSANDASTAVAEYLYGSDQDFINAMNSKARQLGLKDTNFANETGLPDPKHYSSAYDLAVISSELLKYPEVLSYTSIWLDSLRGGKFILRNTNELIKTYRGADGLKTGHTDEAKFCLAATAKKGNFRLLSVIMGAESDPKRVSESRRLLDYGYRNFQWKLLQKADRSESVYIPEAKTGKVPVKLRNDFGVVVDRGRDFMIKRRTIIKQHLSFPIKSGAEVARLEAVYQGKVLGATPLLAVANIKRANPVVIGWRKFINLIRAMFSFTVDPNISSFAK